MTYNELFKIISKPWLDIKDIKLIAEYGRDKANIIINDIINDIKEKGNKIPKIKRKIVPTEYVIQYLNINVDFVSNMALKEKKILI